MLSVTALARVKYKMIAAPIIVSTATIPSANRTLVDRMHLVLRSLMVLEDDSVELKLETHRALVSFIAGFEPEHSIFAEISQAQPGDMANFLDLGWVQMEDIILDDEANRGGNPPYLTDCPKAYRTLTGFLRPSARQCPAKLQTLLPQTWPSSTEKVLPPNPRLQFRLEDQQAVENPSSAPHDPHARTG